jgi:hypothetical protein
MGLFLGGDVFHREVYHGPMSYEGQQYYRNMVEATAPRPLEEVLNRPESYEELMRALSNAESNGAVTLESQPGDKEVTKQWTLAELTKFIAEEIATLQAQNERLTTGVDASTLAMSTDAATQKHGNKLDATLEPLRAALVFLDMRGQLPKVTKTQSGEVVEQCESTQKAA